MSRLIECWVCGKPHEYCPTCGETHGWKYVACCPEHYQVHMAIENYRCGVFTKEEAINAFSQCGAKSSDDLSWMLPNVETGVREIIGSKSQSAKTKKSKIFKDE